MEALDKPQAKRIHRTVFLNRLAKPLEFFQVANIVMASGLAGTRAGQKACPAHRLMRQRATGPALLSPGCFHQRKARRGTS
ncbi:hypothetical protein [Polaromonas glacialis]|uniref:hypothetical protein n=1 Tax=Polaromonas glacialis TaxID=866564 RepID=UPI0012EB86B9|nr:hypothetical protein [Polaromonas glacialis]